MGRIARRARTVSVALGAALLAVAVAGVAGTYRGGETPRLDYAAYPLDDRLALGGRPVRAEIENRREAMLAREKARVAASQPYAPAPAIWRIADTDTSIYIFGTVHSLPPGFRWRNPGLEAVIVRADSLLLESTEGDGTAEQISFREGMKPEALAALPPLIDRVSPANRAKLAELQAMLSPEAVTQMDAMPTWIAAMGVGFVRDLIAGDMPGQGADDWLEQHFRATGRPVEAIESSAGVVANINAIPEGAQRLMLEAALTAPTRTRDQLDGPAHAWARGDVSDESLLRIRPEQLDPAATLADPLLDRRNGQWVDYLLARMARPGTVLFAAGAGHFVGPGSVIDLLRRRGMRVERVQ